MIDFLKLQKHFTDKGKPFLGHCIPKGETFDYGGWQWYELQGVHPIKVGWSESRHLMKVEGSLSYFSQGHNFTFSNANLIKAVDFVGNITQCSLWDSEVTEIEFGKIIKTPFPPKDYIRNTCPIKGYIQTQTETFLKRFKAKFLDIKIYDAGRNIKMKQKGIDDRAVIIQQGWNPDENFLKIETHYYKPYKVLNYGREILLADILLPDFEDRMKEDLFLHYNNLHKMKSIVTPDNKKDLSTPSILMMMLAEVSASQGQTLDEVKKALYRKIDLLSEVTDETPEPVLTKEDGKARKKQMRALLERLHLSEVSQWDISAELEEALNHKSVE